MIDKKVGPIYHEEAMGKTYLILGYGIPQDISTDLGYNIYLRAAFNRIFDESHGQPALIIASGGKTDMAKPYRRTEAGEIIRYLKNLTRRADIKSAARYWKFAAEGNSLSTLENFLNTSKLLKTRGIASGDLTIFCEQTRHDRVRKITKSLLPKFRTRVIPIDFDVSLNRYLNPQMLAEKEKREWQHIRWALQSPENLKKHHRFFVEKIRFLRAQGPDRQPEAVKEWMENKLKEIGQSE